MPLIQHLGDRGRSISEFDASLVYKVSSRIARTTQRNPVLKKNKSKQTNKKNQGQAQVRYPYLVLTVSSQGPGSPFSLEFFSNQSSTKELALVVWIRESVSLSAQLPTRSRQRTLTRNNSKSIPSVVIELVSMIQNCIISMTQNNNWITSRSPCEDSVFIILQKLDTMTHETDQ